jgi:hypothetical protein
MLLHKMLHAKWKCSKYQIIVFCLTRPDRVSNSRFTTIEARKENIRVSWINLGTFTLIDQGFEFWNWGYNCCFFLNFVPLHIESPYNFGGTGPILGVKKPLQRVNGHAELDTTKSVENILFSIYTPSTNNGSWNIEVIWFLGIVRTSRSIYFLG